MARGTKKDPRPTRAQYYNSLKQSFPTRAELAAEYQRLAKQADQRMVRLEKLAAQGGIYENVEHYAYRAAEREIKRFGGTPNKEDRYRFNRNKPLNYNELVGKTAAIKRFLDAPTSTKKGIIRVFKDKAEIYNQATGSDFTWEQFAKYWQSGLADKLASYGYATRNAAIAQIKKKMETVAEEVNEADEKIENVADEVLDDKIEQIMAQYGDEIKNLLS